jgi:hypothetical protein
MVKLAERITRQNNQSGISGMVNQFNRSLNTLSVCFGHCLNALDSQPNSPRPTIPRSRFTLTGRLGRG